jgi:hypothetical protein
LRPLPCHFHCAPAVCHPKTRVYVRLLGPCFKTGRLKPFRQHLQHACAAHRHAPGRPPRTTCSPQRPPGTSRALSQPAGAHCLRKDPRSPQATKTPVCNTARERLPSRRPHLARATHADPPEGASTPPPAATARTRRLRCRMPARLRSAIDYAPGTASFNRFPFNGFTCF